MFPYVAAAAPAKGPRYIVEETAAAVATATTAASSNTVVNIAMASSSILGVDALHLAGRSRFHFSREMNEHIFIHFPLKDSLSLISFGGAAGVILSP